MRVNSSSFSFQIQNSTRTITTQNLTITRRNYVFARTKPNRSFEQKTVSFSSFYSTEHGQRIEREHNNTVGFVIMEQEVERFKVVDRTHLRFDSVAINSLS